jgi:hypothetical protein
MNDNNIKSKRLSPAKVIASLAMSILLWSVVVNAWGYTYLLFGAESGSIVNQVYDFISRFVWTIPAIVLLRVYRSDIPVSLSALFKNRPYSKPFIITIACVILYNIGAMLVHHGGFWINPNFSPLRHTVMFAEVAFVEELVYRGWGMNALLPFIQEKNANFI